MFSDHIICLEDGKKLLMLKRHLRVAYNMAPEEYRAKWACQSRGGRPGPEDGKGQHGKHGCRLTLDARPATLQWQQPPQ